MLLPTDYCLADGNQPCWRRRQDSGTYIDFERVPCQSLSKRALLVSSPRRDTRFGCLGKKRPGSHCSVLAFSSGKPYKQAYGKRVCQLYRSGWWKTNEVVYVLGCKRAKTDAVCLASLSEKVIKKSGLIIQDFERSSVEKHRILSGSQSGLRFNPATHNKEAP